MRYLLDTNIISELIRDKPNQNVISFIKSIMDLLIASTCIAKNLILVTRNEKDFKALDIELINPFEIETPNALS